MPKSDESLDEGVEKRQRQVQEGYAEPSDEDDIETIGQLIRQPRFVVQIVLAIESISVFAAMNVGKYWPIFCIKSPSWLVNCVVGGVFTSAVFYPSSLIAWLLVDDSSWLLHVLVNTCICFLYLITGIFFFLNMKDDCLPTTNTKPVKILMGVLISHGAFLILHIPYQIYFQDLAW